MPEAEELLSSLRQMQLDPEMREFRPLIEELIAGIETPGYDNIELVWKLFERCSLAFHCREIAESLYYFNIMNPPPRKKWYEMDD